MRSSIACVLAVVAVLPGMAEAVRLPRRSDLTKVSNAKPALLGSAVRRAAKAMLDVAEHAHPDVELPTWTQPGGRGLTMKVTRDRSIPEVVLSGPGLRPSTVRSRHTARARALVAYVNPKPVNSMPSLRDFALDQIRTDGMAGIRASDVGNDLLASIPTASSRGFRAATRAWKRDARAALVGTPPPPPAPTGTALVESIAHVPHMQETFTRELGTRVLEAANTMLAHAHTVPPGTRLPVWQQRTRGGKVVMSIEWAGGAPHVKIRTPYALGTLDTDEARGILDGTARNGVKPQDIGGELVGSRLTSNARLDGFAQATAAWQAAATRPAK